MIITIDTGGTKTLIAGFSERGKVLAKTKFPTPKQPKKYISAISETLKDLFEEYFEQGQVQAISVAMPAIVEDGVVVWAQNLRWRNFDVKSELQIIFSKKIPIFVENDANLAGLSEARFLDKPENTVLYLTVSTGIGAGIISESNINRGLRKSEAGRIIVEYDGSMREWESFASGKAIFETYGIYTRDITKPKMWLNISDRISRGLLVLIPIVQPEIVIIGGSVGSQFDKYGRMLTNIVKERLPTNIPCPRIVKAQNPEEAVIYGCYEYAKDQLDK
ncbi:MAG: ROK family protein [Candidatus Sacchiramonaceae bacterium]|nr:ROK family protein [Candidatus Saccharimonadaceae bacterium]